MGKREREMRRERSEFIDFILGIALSALIIFALGCSVGYRATMLAMELEVLNEGHTVVADVFGFEDVYYIEDPG